MWVMSPRGTSWAVAEIHLKLARQRKPTLRCWTPLSWLIQLRTHTAHPFRSSVASNKFWTMHASCFSSWLKKKEVNSKAGNLSFVGNLTSMLSQGSQCPYANKDPDLVKLPLCNSLYGFSDYTFPVPSNSASIYGGSTSCLVLLLGLVIEDREGKDEPTNKSVTKYSPWEGEILGQPSPGTMISPTFFLRCTCMLAYTISQQWGFLVCICTHFYRHVDSLSDIWEGSQNQGI